MKDLIHSIIQIVYSWFGSPFFKGSELYLPPLEKEQSNELQKRGKGVEYGIGWVFLKCEKREN